MKVSAKTFAARTGFPLKLIRRMCRTGQLEHWRIGRVYLLDEEKTIAALEMYKAAAPAYTPAREQNRCRNVKPYNDGYTSRTARLKAMIKQRKAAAAATATAKAGSKPGGLNKPAIRIIAQ